MNERLKSFRKEIRLTQEEFAERLGLSSKGTISALESGARDISDRIIKQICQEFNANEEWLRTGEGEMFFETTEAIISDLTKQYDLDDTDQKIIMEYAKLNKEQKEVIKDFMRKSVGVPYNEAIKTYEPHVMAAHNEKDLSRKAKKEINEFKEFAAGQDE